MDLKGKLASSPFLEGNRDEFGLEIRERCQLMLGYGLVTSFKIGGRLGERASTDSGLRVTYNRVLI